MSIRKCRRSTQFICPACGINFGSQDSLSHHAYDRIDAYDDSSCLDSLFKCEFCDELWPNKKSLSHHMTFNKRCKRIQNLQDDMSKLHPKCIVASSSANSSEEPPFFLCKRIAEENEKESLVETNILGFDLSLSQAMERNRNKKRKKQIHQTPTQKYLVEKPSAFLDQVMQCTQVNSLTKSKIDSFISQNRDDYNDDLCASGARFCNELLGLSNAASGDCVLKGTLREMLIDIKNTATRSHLETGSESLPGFSSTSSFFRFD